MTREELQAKKRVLGFVNGEPVVTIELEAEPRRGPIEIKLTEPFTVSMPIPALHRPQCEILMEELHAKGDDGTVLERAFYMTSASVDLRVGDVTLALPKIEAFGETREETQKKIVYLIGMAIVQVYVKLMRGEPHEVEAARSMEERRHQT